MINRKNPMICAALAVLIFALSACMSEPVGPGPDIIGEMYYSAIKDGDFEAAARLYMPNVSPQAVVMELENTRHHMGELKSYRRTDLVSYSASGGIRYTLRYMVQYENGHVTEGLMLFQSGTDNLVRIEQTNRL